MGIILCKDKNKIIVEYALNQSTSPVGIAEYKLVSTLPENLQKQLPTTEQIAEILDII
ncbi:MAG: PDDEXK nuclease domain-containing protein [Aridibacter sp.]